MNFGVSTKQLSNVVHTEAKWMGFGNDLELDNAKCYMGSTDFFQEIRMKCVLISD